MPSDNTTFFICNPMAGAGSAGRKWLKFERRLHKRGLHPDAVFTEYPGHATELATACIREGCRKIAIFGGDGTLNEALQGVVDSEGHPPPDLQLIFLAAGSSCDLEKAFPERVPLHDRLTSGQSYWLDVCKAECRNFAGEPITRYFLNNSSIGVISLGTHKFNCARGFHLVLKRMSMNAAAIVIGLSAIAEYEDILGEVTLDASATHPVRLSNLTVFKTPYFAGGMYLGAQTERDDGIMHVALIDATSRLVLAGMIPSLYTGTIFRHQAAHHNRCRELVLDTEQPVFIDTDGEIIGHPPVRYSVIPRAIQIII